MKPLITPGSGIDDLGAGMALGCLWRLLAISLALGLLAVVLVKC